MSYADTEAQIDCVAEFAKANYHPLRQRNNKTVETYNKMVWFLSFAVKIKLKRT